MVNDQKSGSSRQSANKFLEESSFVEDTLDNDNYQTWLKKEDIASIGKIEYGWFGDNGNVIFEVIGSEQLQIRTVEEHIIHFIELYKDKLKDKSLTFIIDLNNFHWVTLVITQFEQQFSAYYVDSLGQELPYDINNALKDVVKSIKDFKSKQQHNGYNCGIFALENARIINDALQKSNDLTVAVSDIQLTDTFLTSKREEFARAIRRRDIIENKFEVLAKFLKKLTEQHSKLKEFNFQNANILLFFLETLSLQDISLQDSGCQDPKSKLRNYEQKLVDQGIFDLDDLKCVQNIRTNVIFHRDVCSRITPINFKDIVKNDQVIELFQNLEKYVLQTYIKLKGGMANQSDLKKLRELFNERDEIKQFGEPITQKQLRNQISNFFKKATAEVCYRDDRLNLENANEIMFNFLVNIIPFIDKLYKKPTEPLGKIKLFRGDLIHKFYEFGDNYKLISIELKYFMRSYGPHYFRYYYSQKVYSALCKIECREAGYISDYLRDLLRKFQNDYGKDYFATKEDIDNENSFEFVVSDLVYSEDNKNNLENFVHEYLKLMSIIDNEEAIEIRERKHKKSEVPARYKELNANDRRQIYEDFKLLKDIFKMNKKGIVGSKDIYDKEMKLLQKKLKGPYGILKDDFNAMIKSYVKNDDGSRIDGEHTIVKALFVLNEIKKHHPNISNQDITRMFTERKDIQGNKGSLQQKFNSIPEGRNIKVLVPNGKTENLEIVSINTDRFTKNIFEIFNSTYIQYRLVFNNIEEAFNDEIFLDYLTNENAYGNTKLIEKLLKIDYMTPYVARLVSKDEFINRKMFTDKEFLDVIEKLLKKDSYVKHLKKLLKECSGEKLKNILKPNDKNFNKNKMNSVLYEHICNKIISNNIDIKNLYIIFEEPQYTEEILMALCKNIGSINNTDAVTVIKKILTILNNIACKLYNENNKDCLNVALKLLDSKKGAQEARKILIKKKLVEKNDLSFLQTKRNIARIKNRQGKLERNTDKAKGLYSMSYGILLSMKNDIHNNLDDNLFPHFLLTLSDLAYTCHLLYNCNQACDTYKTLYQEMIKSILNLSDESISGFELSKHYNSIIQSETYKKFLKLSPKYLNILKIRSDIGNELKCLAETGQKLLPKNRSQDYEMQFNEVLHLYLSALNIYEEVNEIKAGATIVQGNVKTMLDMAYIHSRLGYLRLSNAQNDKEMKCALTDVEKIKILESALSDNEKALKKYEEIKKIQAQEKWETHPAVLDIQQNIVKVMRSIAFIHNKLGNLKKSINREKVFQHYNEALRIYKEALSNQEKTLGKEHEYTLNTMWDIAYSKNNLAKLISQDKPNEALELYDESVKIYEKILAIQIKKLGTENYKTKKTQENLTKTKNWRNCLSHKIQFSGTQKFPKPKHIRLN